MNFQKSDLRTSHIAGFYRTCDCNQTSYKILAPQGPFSFLSQKLRHDQEDLHKQQGAVEAAECQQCFCQAEETHPHPPSRQKTEQKWNASSSNEVYQLLGQGIGGAKSTANRRGCPAGSPGAFPLAPHLPGLEDRTLLEEYQVSSPGPSHRVA